MKECCDYCEHAEVDSDCGGIYRCTIHDGKYTSGNNVCDDYKFDQELSNISNALSSSGIIKNALAGIATFVTGGF